MKIYSDVRQCPYCEHGSTKVIQSWQDDFKGYVRRRKCLSCGKLFKTYERTTEDIEDNLQMQAINKVIDNILTYSDKVKDEATTLAKINKIAGR